MNILEPGGFYHVYNHAVGSDNLFRNGDNYSYFLKKYDYYIQPIAKTYAYCLMPNHFHLLLQIRSKEELEGLLNLQGLKDLEGLNIKIIQQFSNFFNCYSKSYNKYYGRRGALFCHNFKRRPIENEQHLISSLIYIHRNPVHHGFCNSLDEWAWSSYMVYLNNRMSFIEKKEIIILLGSKKKFVREHQINLQGYFELMEDDI